MPDKNGMNYDPVDYYQKFLSARVKDVSREYFDGLLKGSGVDESENRSDCQNLEKKVEFDKSQDKILRRYRVLVGFTIFFIVVGFVAAIVGLVLLFAMKAALAGGLCLGLGLGLAVLLLVVYFVSMRKKLNQLNAEDIRRNEEITKLKNIIAGKVSPLWKMFSWIDFKKIVTQTTDMFTIDEKLPESKLSLIKALYKYTDVVGPNDSVVALMSGDIDTNPYIRMVVKSEKEITYHYSGSITIHWTETYRDSQGNLQTRMRSQVLVAYYDYPGPMFSDIPITVYGNNAAPDLSFTRSSNREVNVHDEKALRKYVEKEEKNLRKKAEKSVLEGGHFQPMANTEFEALFHAYDRDHEVQYRLLFTPLAQQNMQELLKGKAGYGDDFAFVKRRKVNIIQSDHSANVFAYDSHFAVDQLDIGKLRENFISYMSELFKSLYFDLAPIFAIPLYQMTDAGEFDPEIRSGADISEYEAMRTVNSMNPRAFMHPEANTDQILKTTYSRSVGNTDVFDVSSLSFKAIPKVILIPTMGGDGRMHNVPVQYKEYVPVTNSRQVGIRRADPDKEDWNLNEMGAYLNRRNGNLVNSMMGFFVGDAFNDTEEEEVERLFSQRSKK